MHTHFTQDEIPYTGAELSSHWIYRTFGTLGDAVVAFIGPAQVDQTHMVDLEDVLKNDFIYSRKMLNFIIEAFGMPLHEGVVLQRLFSSILQDRINRQLGGLHVQRRGDDLFVQGTRKLSVSICTASPTSILIHTGLNIDSAGAPVEAAGLLSELGMDNIESLARECMEALAEELDDIGLCCCKVRAVS